MTPSQLRQIRQHTGLSQEDFAAGVDYAKSTIAMMETGKRNIHKRFIKLIQKKYKKGFTTVIN